MKTFLQNDFSQTDSCVCKRSPVKIYPFQGQKSTAEGFFAYIIEELFYEREDILNKEAYYNEIINTIIRINRAKGIYCGHVQSDSASGCDHLHIGVMFR